jgi:hypothetical protein
VRILEPARAPNSAPPAPDFLEMAFDELASLFVGVVKSLREHKRLTLLESLSASVHVYIYMRVCVCVSLHVFARVCFRVCCCVWLCARRRDLVPLRLFEGVVADRLSLLLLKGTLLGTSVPGSESSPDSYGRVLCEFCDGNKRGKGGHKSER